MRRRPGVQQALDEARFGATRVLNVRDGLLSGAEAVRRADGWLRAKQVEGAGEVLVITGRGHGSVGQVPVVREHVRLLLSRLRRQGVVSAIGEHTAGSFAVRLAPLRALFEAPPRRRDAQRSRDDTPRGGDASTRSANAVALAGLAGDLQAQLRRLALHALDALGIANPDERFVEGEMQRTFSTLARAAGERLSEDWLRSAMASALREYEEGDG